MRSTALRELYRFHFRDHRRERLFLSSVSFLVAFAVIRGVTHAIRAKIGPFHNLAVGTLHVHHLVWGILLLIAVGYLELLGIGTATGSKWSWFPALLALLYGVAAALTLDEFALWLNLADVYWSRQGRESIEAIIIFGAFLSAGFWGGSFLHALARRALRPLRR